MRGRCAILTVNLRMLSLYGRKGWSIWLCRMRSILTEENKKRNSPVRTVPFLLQMGVAGKRKAAQLLLNCFMVGFNGLEPSTFTMST